MFVDRFLEWAYQSLLHNEQAQEYLLGRGISKDQWLRHSIGYVGGDFDVDSSKDPNHSAICDDREKRHKWCDSCRYRNWSSTWEELVENGPKIQIIGRRAVGSVVFPLTSYSGSRIGWQTRSIQKKEYDTFAISRRPEGYFFGSSYNIEAIWSTREAFLVEGPGDQQLIERLVAPNVLALTTSGMSKLQLRFLKRFVKRLWLCLDLDDAGRKGVKSIISQHDETFDIIDLKYPRVQEKDKDPGDYWRRVGDDAFSRYFKRAIAQETSRWSTFK